MFLAATKTTPPSKSPGSASRNPPRAGGGAGDQAKIDELSAQVNTQIRLTQDWLRQVM